MKMPKLLEELSCGDIEYIFFDIDDTFTTHGKISKDAFVSLWNLHERGKKIIPVTGRPAGWCDHIARMWPVDAVVGENGAFYFMMKNNKLYKQYLISEEERIANNLKLEKIKHEILKKLDKVRLSKDQNYREFDLAIDFAEEVTIDIVEERSQIIKEITNIFKFYKANCKISSIHVNGWFGNYDKVFMTKQLANKEFFIDLDKESDNQKCVFCGDSPNDMPMFDLFNLSVGVNNVLDFYDQLKNPPKYITKHRYGEGFRELVIKILDNQA